MHPLAIAEEALDLLPDAQLRVLEGTGLPDGLRRPGRASRASSRPSACERPHSLPSQPMYELSRPDSCSVGRAMDILGERWTFLILRESFYGVRRFSDMQRNLGIARNILSNRLQTLVGAGILERRRYQEEPERYEYRLTETGRGLYPAIIAIMRWGDEHLNDALAAGRAAPQRAARSPTRCSCAGTATSRCTRTT